MRFGFSLGRFFAAARCCGCFAASSLEPDSCVRRTQNLFVRYGLRGVIAAKFLPGFGAMIPPLAGMSRVSAARFLVMDAFGSAIYGACYISLGFLFSNQIERIVAEISQIGVSLIGLLAGLAARYIVVSSIGGVIVSCVNCARRESPAVGTAPKTNRGGEPVHSGTLQFPRRTRSTNLRLSRAPFISMRTRWRVVIFEIPAVTVKSSFTARVQTK